VKGCFIDTKGEGKVGAVVQETADDIVVTILAGSKERGKAVFADIDWMTLQTPDDETIKVASNRSLPLIRG
jgi:hypothetical protein